MERERYFFSAAVRQAETKKSARFTGYSTSDHAGYKTETERLRIGNGTPRGLFSPYEILPVRHLCPPYTETIATVF